MATLSRAESKAMYSWWWDSHISPKNSKWLQENLTDMDNKVRTMIKLIEVDEDSFARRAEMYYKKRPELMKLVEEFYRAYRALAERYDNATGVIRQAHRTMAEAFPNQVPFLMTDDGPLNLTPNQTPVQASSGFLSLNGDGDFTDDSISVADQKAKKQLNFHEMEENKQDMKGNGNLNAHVVSESERWRQFEIDIQDLKEALAELEAEKEEKLSKLDFEVSRAKENSKGLNERATVAEVEVQSLKETLANVEAEKEASLLRCQQCLERISNLEIGISQAEQDSKKLSDRACKAEDEAELLKDELNQLKAEKESLLTKYMEALEKTANLENRLLLAEDCAGRTSVRADRAEKEAETLRESITKLTTEKEAAIVKCEQCLEKKANLEHEVTLAREEAVRLRTEVQDGAAKLKDSKKQFRLLDRSNKALQSELDSLVKKQKELGRLWTSVQEERMRSEAAMKSLQNSHSEVQEKLGSVSAELQKKVQDLKDLQIQNQSLEDEVEKVKNENKDLNDLNLSSVVLIKDFQGEIFDLKEGKRRLEQELASHHDQRSSLQQEIYCLKEELSNLNQRHRDIMGQIESLGFPSESFCSSMKELQDENSRLIETCKKNNVEISSLGEKLDAMEKLVEKNELLENSLLDLQAELEGTRKKVKVLDESFHLLLGEKSVLGAEKAALMTQLQITTENLEKLSERNLLFEKSLFDANIELEMLRMKSKNLEDSFCVFIDQNSVLATDKETLARQLGTTKKKISALEEERALTLQRVEELLVLLDVEKHDHAKSRELSQTRIHDLDNQVRLLQETSYNTRKEFEKELDKAANAQFDIFILQNCIHDLNATIIKLLEINEELIFKVREGDEKEVVHLAEMECLREKVFTLQWAFEDLQKENCEVIEDKESLMKAFDALAEEKSNLEHECSCAVAEAIACDNLSSVLNNVIFDTTTQFLEWTKNVARLCHDNELLEENARILEQKLDEVLAAHVELEASLKKSENELEEVKSVNDELKVEIANGKDLLSLKEMELLEAMARKINQENRTSKLSESYAEQLKECERLHEVVKHLDSQVSKMNEEHEKTDVSVTILSSELQNGKDEVKLWETVAGTFFTELQSSSLREAIIKEKYSELVKACEILEDESSSKCMDVVQLRERVGVLEGENAHLKDQLAVGYSAILSLRDSLASIEKHTIWQKELCKTDKEDKEDMKQCQNLNDDEVAGAQSNKIFVLQEVQDRVQAVEKAIIDLKHHAEEQYSTVRSELDLAMRQIELLKSQSGSRRRSGGLSVRLASRQDCNLKSNSAYGYELQKSSSSISERANDHLMRDIMLDQVSDWSSHGKNRKVNGSDDRILELWETTNQGEGIDLTVGKFSHIKAVKESKNDRPSLESTVDKELCVDDQLDISNKICEIRLDNYKRKTLDRLTSDVQKLSNLKITVQDLKEKLEMTEKFSSDGVESDGIKDQLVGSEETISKLYDYSEKLIKKIQNSSLASTSSSFDGSVTADSMDGGGSARRRRYSEHARRISEKIGRLQLEVQKVQFLLMKIDNNKASKSGAEIMENDSQTLLRDYLYSGAGVSKTARKKKKSQFCGCMQNPATKGD